MNEWMKSREREDNRCALLQYIFLTLEQDTRYIIYNGARSLLKSERKERGR